MKRRLLALIAPPVAVCRFGCAGCCAAPIGVFWIAGMVSIIYAFFGGPSVEESFSSGTFLLGLILWIIASIWAELTINGIDADDKCDQNSSTLCRVVKPTIDDSNPLDEIKKFQ
ncbi:MAG: hypothetical protein QM484_10540 [Woeseiaceae bacterium]